MIYHAFMAGIFVGLSYEVESNQENGLGRTDIILTDTANRRAIIIEARKSDSENDMEHACFLSENSTCQGIGNVN